MNTGLRGITRSQINLYKSAFEEDIEKIQGNDGKTIKEVLPDLDYQHCVIYVNGFQKDETYTLQEDDLCTIRQFPSYGFWDALADVATGGAYSITKGAVEVTTKALEVTEHITEKTLDTTKYITDQVNAGFGALWEQLKAYIDSTKTTDEPAVETIINEGDTVITNNYQNKTVQALPTVQGAVNSSQLNQVYPLVLGHSYFAPHICADSYTLVSGEDGEKCELHRAYLLGYNDINVTDIKLGLKSLASNSARLQNGYVEMDGGWFEKGDVVVEVRTDGQLETYPQKVVQDDFGEELLYPKGAKPYIAEKFSSRYPEKVEVEFLIDGLVGKDSTGAESSGTVSFKVEYSLDGGKTYTAFDKIEGMSDYKDGVQYLTRQKYKQMRFVATKSFDFNTIKSATNNVIEIRCQRMDEFDDDKLIQGAIYLSAIRTWCYDPLLSKNSFAHGRVICDYDKTKVMMLGLKINITDQTANVNELNCVLRAKGRIWDRTKKTWSSTYSETSNPASMALVALQSKARGLETYADSEIDLLRFGEFYEFCEDYDIKNASGTKVGFQCNGVVTKEIKTSDLIDKILNCGRGYRIVRNKKVSVFIDKKKTTPVLVINNQNIISASNSKSFSVMPNSLILKFTNEDNYYQQDSKTVYDDGYNASMTELSKLEIPMDFQTNVEQVMKNGYYELAKLKLRPEKWVRTVTTEGSLAEVGSLICLQDDTILVGRGDGAEITNLVLDSSNNIVGIETDGFFEVSDVTKNYGVLIQQADGVHDVSIVKREVSVQAKALYQNFVFKTPIAVTETNKPNVGDILSFGEYNKISSYVLCMGKKDNGNGTYTLTFVPYSDSVYTADTGKIGDYSTNVTPPLNYGYTIPHPVTIEMIQHAKAEIEKGNPSYLPPAPTSVSAVANKDTISLKAVHTSENLYSAVQSYEFEIKKKNGTVTVLTSSANTVDYDFNRTVDGYLEKSDLDKWQFRCRVKSIYDVYSEWSSYVTCTYGVNNYTWIPAKPVATSPVVGRDGFTINWSNQDCLGTPKYRVIVSYDGEKLFESEDIYEKEFTYNFDRFRDGYPETEEIAGVKTLSKYSFVVKHYNESIDVTKAVSSDSQILDTSRYLTWLPTKPELHNPIATRDGFTVTWNYSENYDIGEGRFLVNIYYDDKLLFTSFEIRQNNSYVYSFDRDLDGYPEVVGQGDVKSLEKYHIEVKHFNNEYGEDKANISDKARLITSGYSTWIPSKPILATPVAEKNGFKIKWNYDKSYADSIFCIKVYKGEDVLRSFDNIVGGNFTYDFDRNIDGYPEKDVLSNYRVEVINYNEVYNQSKGTVSEKVSLDTLSYGTWKIGTLSLNNITSEVIDRTVMLNLSIPSSSLEYYGNTQYKVSIKRIGVSYAGDNHADYPSVEEDENWYKPNLFASPLSHESNYRTEDIDGYVISGNKYSQTLPLAGQSEGKVVNTVYQYKISAFNEVGIDTNSIETVVTALCTSIRDIVQAHEDYKTLYVGRLSALNADVGLLSQGGFGSFKDWTNFWALSDMRQEDTELDTEVKRGAFRVGDENQYIAVIPPKSTFGKGENQITNESDKDFMIQIKAGNITLTSNTDTTFEGGTYVYDEADKTKRMRMVSSGIEIQQYNAEKDVWDQKANFSADTDGNLTVTNANSQSGNLPQKGIELAFSTNIYHLENTLLDTNGKNGSNLIFDINGTFEESALVKNKTTCFNGSVEKESILDEDICLFTNSDTIFIGNNLVKLAEDGSITTDNTVDYWKVDLNINNVQWEK